MSGRSAFARVKFSEQGKDIGKGPAGEDGLRAYAHKVIHSHHLAGNPSGSGLTYPSANYSSCVSSALPRRSESSVHSGTSYEKSSLPIRRPQPLVLNPAIEKSDARVQMEGIGAVLRNRIGKLMNIGDDGPVPSRTRPVVMASELSLRSRKSDTIPSVDAVPALSPSVSPETDTFPMAIHDCTAEFEKYKGSFRRFRGGGKLPQLNWTSLSDVSHHPPVSLIARVMLNMRQNPELWDEEGDTFVYLFARGNRTKIPPAFRIKSQVIMDSGSVTFKDQLRHIVEPEGWPRFYPCEDLSVRRLQAERSLRPTTSSSRCSDEISPFHGAAFPSSHVSRAPGGIRYEIYVPWPGMKESGTHEVLWHVTTRNFFAIMLNSTSIIGTTWYEAFSAVLKRIVSYPGYLAEGGSPVDWIVEYIVRHKFDDVRNNPSYATSLLAFSELPNVQWREGYIEAFVHCVGMFQLGKLDGIVEWQYVTPHTQIYISNAAMEMEDRIHRAQSRLASFDLTDMWPANSAPPTCGRGCFDRLRKWLCRYYEDTLGHWPPSRSKNENTWLSYQVVQILKHDFHTLYDYLVDRDIMFERYMDRSREQWRIINKSDRSFRPDSSDLPLTDILVAFDNRNNFPHVPHPFPHTPRPISAQSKAKIAFRRTATPGKIQAESRQKKRAYAEACNVYFLHDVSINWDLVLCFIRFEQSDMLQHIDPSEARRGRWILIYGILQVLATVSVDSPNLRYKEGTLYHLSPQMKGIVPWANLESAPEEQAQHVGSHCWKVPSTWAPAKPKARAGAHQPIIQGEFGDGRHRSGNADGMPEENINSRSGARDPGQKMELVPSQLEQGPEIRLERAQRWVETVGGMMADDVLSASDNRENRESIGDVLKQSTEDLPSDAATLAARRRKALLF
jgi:hypothetical protein